MHIGFFTSLSWNNTYKFKEIKVYSVFIEDLFNQGAINLLNLSSNQLKNISEISVTYNLDFDDSYQYVVAENNSLEIVSFDKDFKNTPLGKLEPKEVISKYKST